MVRWELISKHHQADQFNVDVTVMSTELYAKCIIYLYIFNIYNPGSFCQSNQSSLQCQDHHKNAKEHFGCLVFRLLSVCESIIQSP